MFPLKLSYVFIHSFLTYADLEINNTQLHVMFSLIFKRLLLYPERSTPNKDQLSYFSSPVNTARCSLEVSISSLKNKILLWTIAVCYLIIVNTWMYYQESRILGKKNDNLELPL